MIKNKLKTMREKMRKNEGFTLVELIVVIVIILILAAVLVPNLLKYVDRANQANCKADAATLLTQIQADYANSQTPDGTDVETTYGGIKVTKAEATVTAATVKGDDAAAAYFVKAEGNSYGEITSFAYNNGKYTAVWSGNAWVVNKNAE
ncbi:MAG: prepilin-type N-terminal cleavage/methylation domain-containing protein [Hespellia sp.]|nr:prepilin-type N-terminal cleavage/methylation domain-containing protein [Hespellia sp.]